MRYPGWVILVVGSACGPAVEDIAEPADAQRYARAVCDLATRCDCNGELLADCETRLVRQFERVNDANGTEFHRDCFEKLTEAIEADAPSCDGMELPFDCLVFEPQVPNQGACELHKDHPDSWVILPTDCGKPGDWCVDGVCRSGVSILAEGDACGLDVANSCGDGLYCGLDGTCQPIRSLGESCDAPRACVFDGYCHGVATPGDIGVCTSNIEEGLTCEPGQVESCGVGGPVACGPNEVCEPRVAACSLAGAYDDYYNRWIWEAGQAG
ncbi:MAG: hypothetical protein ACRBN8_33450 [Nannocystales bacterium]